MERRNGPNLEPPLTGSYFRRLDKTRVPVKLNPSYLFKIVSYSLNFPTSLRYFIESYKVETEGSCSFNVFGWVLQLQWLIGIISFGNPGCSSLFPMQMMKPQKKGSTVRDTEENVNLRKAGKPFALKQIEKAFTGSKIKDNSSTYPQFDFNEVTLGKVLGKGGFGTVYEIRGFEAGKQAKASADDDDDDSDSPPGQIESRQFIAEHCIRKGGDARYALKILSPEVIAEPGTYLQGTVDMAVETRILSDVEHANIVKMRACAKVSPVDETYFIVLDRLYDTMERRMHSWAAANKRLGGMGGKLLDRKGTKKKEILEQKLVAAFDLCAAIGYLHGKNIIYRDLKPENVGFDIVREIKGGYDSRVCVISMTHLIPCLLLSYTFGGALSFMARGYPFQRDDVKVCDTRCKGVKLVGSSLPQRLTSFVFAMINAIAF